MLSQDGLIYSMLKHLIENTHSLSVHCLEKLTPMSLIPSQWNIAETNLPVGNI